MDFTVICFALISLIIGAGLLYLGISPTPPIPSKVKARDLKALIDDIGSGVIYHHRECSTYNLTDPSTDKVYTVSVGTENQFMNTKRLMIAYTILKTPIGSAILLHSRLFVMYPSEDKIELLKRLISTQMRFLPLEIIDEGAICNGGVFLSQDELENNKRDDVTDNYYM